jgi:hypothetical protein
LEQLGNEFGQRISLPSTEEPTKNTGRRILAGLLSSVIPGLGHLILGKSTRAMVFAAALAAYVSFYLAIRTPGADAGEIRS